MSDNSNQKSASYIAMNNLLDNQLDKLQKSVNLNRGDKGDKPQQINDTFAEEKFVVVESAG